MILYMYIAPGQGLTTLWGQNFDVNSNILSLWSFVASLKKNSLKSDLYNFFHDFMYVYRPISFKRPAVMSPERLCLRNVTNSGTTQFVLDIPWVHIGNLPGSKHNPCVVLFVWVKHRFQQFFSHITVVSCCDRELNQHFYSAALLKYHAADT